MQRRSSGQRIYTVTGATGRSGQRVARALLAQGFQVRAVGRDEDRLAPLVAAGAEPFVGDITRREFVERCFAGADAAYLIDSADHMARDFRGSFAAIGRNFADAARTAGLPFAVFVSTIGTHDERFRGFITTHGDVEHILNEPPRFNVLHLRAPNFFENLLYFVPASRAMGALASPIDPDAQIDMAANRDVAELAIQRLIALDFEGKSSVELHGPEVLTIRKIAAMVEKLLERPFPAVHISHEDNVEAMVSAGMHRDFSTLISDTWATFSRYGLLRASPPQRVAVGSSPIRQFLLDEFIPALTSDAESE